MTPEQIAAMGGAVVEPRRRHQGRARVGGSARDRRSPSQTCARPVGTDAETANDMVGNGRSQFNARAGRGHRARPDRQGRRPASVLVLLPDGGMRSSTRGKAGAFAELVDEAHRDTDGRAVHRIPRLATAHTGFVTVSRPLDLGPAFDRLIERRPVGHASRSAARSARSARRRRARRVEPQPIPSQPGAQLVAAEPPLKGGDADSASSRRRGAAGLGLSCS